MSEKGEQSVEEEKQFHEDASGKTCEEESGNKVASSTVSENTEQIEIQVEKKRGRGRPLKRDSVPRPSLASAEHRRKSLRRLEDSSKSEKEEPSRQSRADHASTDDHEVSEQNDSSPRVSTRRSGRRIVATSKMLTSYRCEDESGSSESESDDDSDAASKPGSKRSRESHTSDKRESESPNRDDSIQTSPNSLKKRKVSPCGKKITENRDVFCWQCHRDGNKMMSCATCPRVYHKRCTKIKEVQNTWVCEECNTAMVAGSFLKRSEASSLPQERLNQLFKFVMERVFSHHGAKHFKQAVDINEYPKYRDYVIHPMDLSLIEKNINNSRYKTTESFVIDFKWLVHNSYVFNSPYSELTSFARSMLKIVKQESEEINTCPHCYFHYHTMDDDNWFVEPCEKPHLLVWAKLRGFPYWPAKVMRTVDDTVDVRFFGDHNRSWLQPECCYLFSKSPPFVSKSLNHPDYVDSLKEIFIHIKKLKDKLSEFIFMPPRVKYSPLHHDKLLSNMLPFYNKPDLLATYKACAKKAGGNSMNTPPKLSQVENSFVKKTPPNKILSQIIFKHTNKKFFDESQRKHLKESWQVRNLTDNNASRNIQSNNVNNKPLKICPTNANLFDNNGEPIEIKQEVEVFDENTSSTQYIDQSDSQFVMTRIHIQNSMDITNSNSDTNECSDSTSPGAESTVPDQLLTGVEVKREDCGDSGVDVIPTPDVSTSSETSRDTQSVVPSTGRIVLKVKSSTELLSSEALKSQNLCKTVTDTSASSNNESVNFQSSSIDAGFVTNPSYANNINGTIEKVVRGDISVTLPSRNISKNFQDIENNRRSTEEAFNKFSKDNSFIEEINLDSDLEGDLNSSEGEDNAIEISNDLATTSADPLLKHSRNLLDVENWMSEPSTVFNTHTSDSIKNVFCGIDTSQNLKDCKDMVNKLKKLLLIQKQEMKESNVRIRNEAQEVYEVLSIEKQRLSFRSKELDRKIRKIKLTQWCNYCLKEANFYCCWGTSYCSMRCQRKDWDLHNKFCKHSDNQRQNELAKDTLQTTNKCVQTTENVPFVIKTLSKQVSMNSSGVQHNTVKLHVATDRINSKVSPQGIINVSKNPINGTQNYFVVSDPLKNGESISGPGFYKVPINSLPKNGVQGILLTKKTSEQVLGSLTGSKLTQAISVGGSGTRVLQNNKPRYMLVKAANLPMLKAQSSNLSTPTTSSVVTL